MENNEFDDYLSSTFLEANKRGIESYFSEHKVNYFKLLLLNKNAAVLDMRYGMRQFVAYLRKMVITILWG